MSKERVAYDAFCEETIKIMTDPGLLLVSVDATGRANPMAIGWGTIGVIWGKPIFCVLVRPSRFTHRLIEQSGDFTVNVPTPDLREQVMYCGTYSGRDEDKFAKTGLTPTPSLFVRSPVIEECPVQYECKVVHKNEVLPANLNGEIRQSAYASGDYHTIYFGEILAVHADMEQASQLRKMIDTARTAEVPPDRK